LAIAVELKFKFIVFYSATGIFKNERSKIRLE